MGKLHSEPYWRQINCQGKRICGLFEHVVREIHLMWVILWSDLQSQTHGRASGGRRCIPLGKYLLGATYHLMHQVAIQLLKNEPVHTISGP